MGRNFIVLLCLIVYCIIFNEIICSKGNLKNCKTALVLNQKNRKTTKVPTQIIADHIQATSMHLEIGVRHMQTADLQTRRSYVVLPLPSLIANLKLI